MLLHSGNAGLALWSHARPPHACVTSVVLAHASSSAEVPAAVLCWPGPRLGECTPLVSCSPAATYGAAPQGPGTHPVSGGTHTARSWATPPPGRGDQEGVPCHEGQERGHSGQRDPRDWLAWEGAHMGCPLPGELWPPASIARQGVSAPFSACLRETSFLSREVPGHGLEIGTHVPRPVPCRGLTPFHFSLVPSVSCCLSCKLTL